MKNSNAIMPRPDYEKYLNELESKNVPEYVMHAALQERGVQLRALRVQAGLMHLIILAEQNIETTYGDFGRALHMRSPWERTIVLTHILKMCMDNGWPPYTVLVGAADGSGPGSGFYSYMKDHGHVVTANEAFRAEKIGECFNTSIPDPHKLHTCVGYYINKHL